MIQTNLNLKESNGVTQKEVLETLNDAYEVSEELRSKLSKIRIHIDKNNNPELINAILLIFGPTYISKTGNLLSNMTTVSSNAKTTVSVVVKKSSDLKKKNEAQHQFDKSIFQEAK